MAYFLTSRRSRPLAQPPDPYGYTQVADAGAPPGPAPVQVYIGPRPITPPVIPGPIYQPPLSITQIVSGVPSRPVTALDVSRMMLEISAAKAASDAAMRKIAAAPKDEYGELLPRPREDVLTQLEKLGHAAAAMVNGRVAPPARVEVSVISRLIEQKADLVRQRYSSPGDVVLDDAIYALDQKIKAAAMASPVSAPVPVLAPTYAVIRAEPGAPYVSTKVYAPVEFPERPLKIVEPKEYVYDEKQPAGRVLVNLNQSGAKIAKTMFVTYAPSRPSVKAPVAKTTFWGKVEAVWAAGQELAAALKKKLPRLPDVEITAEHGEYGSKAFSSLQWSVFTMADNLMHRIMGLALEPPPTDPFKKLVKEAATAKYGEAIKYWVLAALTPPRADWTQGNKYLAAQKALQLQNDAVDYGIKLGVEAKGNVSALRTQIQAEQTQQMQQDISRLQAQLPALKQAVKVASRGGGETDLVPGEQLRTTLRRIASLQKQLQYQQQQQQQLRQLLR